MNVDLTSVTSVKSSSEVIAPNVDSKSTSASHGQASASNQADEPQSFAKAYTTTNSKSKASVDEQPVYGSEHMAEMADEIHLEDQVETSPLLLPTSGAMESGASQSLTETLVGYEEQTAIAQRGNAEPLALGRVSGEPGVFGASQGLGQAAATTGSNPVAEAIAPGVMPNALRPSDVTERLMSDIPVGRNGMVNANLMPLSAETSPPRTSVIVPSTSLVSDYGASIASSSVSGNLSLQQFQQALQGGAKFGANSVMSFAATFDGASAASGQAATDSTGVGQLTHSVQSQTVRATPSSVWGPVTVPTTADMTQFGKEMLLPLRDQFRFSVDQGIKKAELRLDPPELGRVEMTIRQDGDRISVQLTAANPMVREALASGAERLRAEMMHGFSEQVSVDVGQGDSRSDAQPKEFKSADILVAVESEHEFTESNNTSSSDLVNTLA